MTSETNILCRAAMLDTKPAGEKAKATLLTIAMCKPISKKSIYATSEQFYQAANCITAGNVEVIILEILRILQIKGKGRAYHTMHLIYASVKLDIIDISDLQLVAIMALNYIPVPDVVLEENLATRIFEELFEFLNLETNNCVLISHAACMWLKRYQAQIDMNLAENLVLKTANIFITLSPYKKTVDNLDKMCSIIVKRTSLLGRDIKLVYLSSLLPTWTSGEAYLASILLRNLPDHYTASSPYLPYLTHKLSHALLKTEVRSMAIKVIDTLIKHCSVDTWHQAFLAPILQPLLKDESHSREDKEIVLTKLANLAVKQYGITDTLGNAVANFIDDFYVATVCCNTSGEVISDIKIILQGNHRATEYFALKRICSFGKKRSFLYVWQLQCLFEYLTRHMFDFNDEYFRELEYFFSHYCVKANEFAYDSDSLQLEMYKEFLNCFHGKCIALIKSRDPKQIHLGARLFCIIRTIFEGDHSKLKLNYSLPLESRYAAKEAPIYKVMSDNDEWFFNRQLMWNLFYQEFHDMLKVSTDIVNLMISWVEESLPGSTDTSRMFFRGLDILRSGFVNEMSDKGYFYIKISLANKINPDKLLCILKNTIERELLNKDFTISNYPNLMKTINETGLYGLIKCITLFLQHNRAPELEFLSQAFTFCSNLIRTIISILKSDPDEKLYTAPRKVIEHVFLGCLEVITFSPDLLCRNTETKYFIEALSVTNLVVDHSNMKKPVTEAANVIHRLALSAFSMQDPILQDVLVKFLEYILFSIYVASNDVNSKIRRNPGHRLIIHAIVTADRRDNNPFLSRSMEFLLKVLSDESSMNGSIASALHSVEIILSDNSLRISTIPYIYSVMVHCIDTFSSKDWRIKNGALQVQKTLIERVLGPRGDFYRQHKIDDIFLLVPKLATYFHSKLQNVHIQDQQESIIAILAIFSESYRNSSVFLPESVETVIDSFLKIFFDIVSTNTTPIRVFAAKAFAAIYPHWHIPFMARDIVDLIKSNFCTMNKNIFFTYVCLLDALLERFSVFCSISYYNEGLNIIKSSCAELTLFLEQFNDLYEFSLFSLLNVKSNSLANVERKLELQLQKSTYQSRLWLNTNVPYLLNNVEVKKIPDILKTCLHGKSYNTKVHCLNAVINRYKELIEFNLSDVTLTVLVEFSFELCFTDDDLLITLSNIILLLFQNSNFKMTKDLLNKLRSQYRYASERNIYFVSIIIGLVSSSVNDFEEIDYLFHNTAIEMYKKAAKVDNYNLNSQSASTLVYLYKCVKVCVRHEVLKLAFILLLNDEMELEIRKFISKSFNVKFCTRYESLEILISFKLLTEQLNDKIQACRLLIDLVEFTSLLPDLFVDNGMFYLQQNSDISAYKYTVEEMLRKEVDLALLAVPENVHKSFLYKSSVV